jgi:hypothetical protein
MIAWWLLEDVGEQPDLALGLDAPGDVGEQALDADDAPVGARAPDLVISVNTRWPVRRLTCSSISWKSRPSR